VCLGCCCPVVVVVVAYPDTTLGVVMLGLKSHVQRINNQSMRQVEIRQTLMPFDQQ
jgi:hypothetical protein